MATRLALHFLKKPEEPSPMEEDLYCNDTLPQEVLLQIFQYLRAQGLARSLCVCRNWKNAASNEKLWNAVDLTHIDLTKVFPELKIINEDTWRLYANKSDLKGLSFHGAALKVNYALIQKIAKIFKTVKVEGQAGMSIVVTPQGLSPNKLWKIAKFPKQGVNAIASTRYISNSFTERLGDVCTSRASVFLITNDVVEGTKNHLPSSRQQTFSKLDAEAPDLLSIATLTVFTYFCSPEGISKRLFSGDVHRERTYALCKEEIFNHHVDFGAFFPEGFSVRLSNDVWDAFLGIAAQWPLPPAAQTTEGMSL